MLRAAGGLFGVISVSMSFLNPACTKMRFPVSCVKHRDRTSHQSVEARRKEEVVENRNSPSGATWRMFPIDLFRRQHTPPWQQLRVVGSCSSPQPQSVRHDFKSISWVAVW